jgi:hypothetical protein
MKKVREEQEAEEERKIVKKQRREAKKAEKEMEAKEAEEAEKEMPTEKVQWSAEEREALFNVFDVQDVFRHDKRHNWDSVSRFSLGVVMVDSLSTALCARFTSK